MTLDGVPVAVGGLLLDPDGQASHELVVRLGPQESPRRASVARAARVGLTEGDAGPHK